MKPTIDPADLVGLTLHKGTHTSPDVGVNLLEAVALLAGEPHSDHPRCVCPVLGEFGRELDEVLENDPRQRLIALIPDLPGTADDGHDEQRSYMALDWVIRTWLPTWLELSPTFRHSAAKLRGLDQIVDAAWAERAGPVVSEALQRAFDEATPEDDDDAWHDACQYKLHYPGFDEIDDVGAAAWSAVEAGGKVSTAGMGISIGFAVRKASQGAQYEAMFLDGRGMLFQTLAALQESAIELYGRMARAGR